MTMPSSAKTSAEKNAVRVRNSIARSLRAMSSAAESVLGAMRHVLAIDREILGRIDRGAALHTNELAGAHDRRVRREREPLGDLVRDEHHRGAGGAEPGEVRAEGGAAGVISYTHLTLPTNREV